ncbi:hypothetical protein [Aquabacterium sp.]|uniref:hypothetical protein n=1 Tax=Aquabacterium sp. TaxID=1872578 RepID=UPI0025BE1E7D|nr:hypothetical protein [Aquabacterium sp.]
MKSRDILCGIAARAAAAMPIEPSFTNLPYEGGVDDFDTLAYSLSEEFPFLHTDKEDVDSANVTKFDGLFAWLADHLRSFPDGAPNPERRLVDMLVLATMLEGNAALWGELAQAVPSPPPLLLEGIAKVFTDTRPEGRVFLERAHYSPEQISSVLDDVARKDWKSVERTMDRLEDRLWLPLKTQTAAALHQYDRPRLEALVDRADDLFEVAAYVLHAPVAQALTLALTCKNWTFKFWAFHRSARFAAAGKQSYPLEWEALLTEAAAVPEEWPRWLAVLNEHPSRYPQIQLALGNALVSASDDALDAYVASISKTADFGRPHLADALGVFRARASLPVRQRLWTAAFKRWKAWDFGCDEESRSLFRVLRSSFDYPVMGYLTECISAETRADMAVELETRAAAIEHAWHSDITPAVSERFKLISTYQLLAHAEAVLAGAPEWLAGEPLYKPSWEDGSAYRSLKYDLNMGKATF